MDDDPEDARAPDGAPPVANEPADNVIIIKTEPVESGNEIRVEGRRWGDLRSQLGVEADKLIANHRVRKPVWDPTMRSLEVAIDEAMRDAVKVEIEPAAGDAGGDPLSALVKAATSESAAAQYKELAPAVILSVLKMLTDTHRISTPLKQFTKSALMLPPSSKTRVRQQQWLQAAFQLYVQDGDVDELVDSLTMAFAQTNTAPS